MKLKENEYIKCCEVPNLTGKTRIYHIINKHSNDVIGVIKWYRSWRQYCFFPASDTLFNNGCLETIKDNLDLLNQEKR